MEYQASRKRLSGFTLIEVMVVVVIMGVITTVVATMFAQGSDALRHGDAHNTLQRAYRLLTARMTPYLASAFDARGLLLGAPLLDPTGTTSEQYDAAPTDSSGATSLNNTLRFITTEDFLAETYPAQGNSAAAAQSLSDLSSFIYQFDVDSNRNVVLQKLDPSDEFNVFDDGDLVEKTIFFSRDRAAIILPLRFYHPATDVVLMEVTLSTNAQPGERTRKVKPVQTFRTTFNLPSKGQ
jgi:prepilin-type N-terminal cleavage/methylation domain-containing protein